jgi:hypothetical protein
MTIEREGGDASETEVDDLGEGQDEQEGQDGEQDEQEGRDGDDPDPKKAAKDLEKRVHNHVGQVARERSRRRAAEARAQELEARISDIERRTGGGQRQEDELLALIGQLPDNEDDPVGDIAALKRALKLYRQREVENEGQTAQQRAMEREVGKVRTAMTESEEDFSVEHPDYFDAAKFYREARVEELKDAGYSGQRLDSKLADDLFGVVRMSLESGQDPAERVYALAARRGFKPGAKRADKNLDKLKSAQESGVRPVARQAGNSLGWNDVAKLDGAARDKAWAKLRERELSRGKA